MAEDAQRHRLRATFNEAAEGYEDARPVAPAEVFDDLAELAHLSPDARVLEIGCGTGKATLPLAERGYSILAVELGDNLADVARRKLAAFPRVEIVTSSFEDWEPGDERFDAVVSFNAFHWIDPEVRFAKPAAVLRPGGSLAVFGSVFVEHEDADRTWVGLNEDYEAVTGEGEPRRLHVDELRDRSTEFLAGGLFGSVVRRTYLWDLTYRVDEYVALLSTFSWFRALDDAVRDELFERIHRRITGSGGIIRPTWSAVLYVATKAA